MVLQPLSVARIDGDLFVMIRNLVDTEQLDMMIRNLLDTKQQMIRNLVDTKQLEWMLEQGVVTITVRSHCII